MSTYRTSMMLYSSVLALSLVAASDGFCENGAKIPESTVVKEKAVEVKSATEKKESSGKIGKDKKEAGVKSKKEVATPLSDAEEDAEEKEKRAKIEQAQKKSAFANKIETIRAKYAALLSAISGEPKEIIAQKLGAHSEKVRAALLDSLSNPKTDVYEKLTNGLKRKNKFIQSKKESVGDDAAWFDEVFSAAEKQLKRLEKLHAEFTKNKDNAAEQEKTRLIYADKVTSFLASYDVFTSCTHYLGTAKAFCNDATISNSNMKVQFPDFSSKAFKEAAVPDDLLSGERAPLARINGYSFYAIDKKEFKKGEYSKGLPADSEDGLLIAAAKKLPEADSKKIFDQETGGIILSSRMVLKPGMNKPLCVFYTYAQNGENEIVSRFSVVHETEENAKAERQLTSQLIKAENQPAYDALAAANEKLKKALAEETLAATGDPKKSKEGKADKPKEDKAEKKAAKKDGEPKEKVKETEGSSKAKESKAAKPKAAESDKPKAVESDKPKAAESDKPKAAEGDKPKAAEGDKPKAAEGDKPKAAEGDKPKAAEGDKPKAAEGDKPKAADSADSKTKKKKSTESTEDADDKKDKSFLSKLFG